MSEREEKRILIAMDGSKYADYAFDCKLTLHVLGYLKSRGVKVFASHVSSWLLNCLYFKDTLMVV